MSSQALLQEQSGIFLLLSYLPYQCIPAGMVLIFSLLSSYSDSFFLISLYFVMFIWFLCRFVRSCKRSIRESDPEAACAAVLLLLSGFPRKRKQISKGFLPAGNPGSSVYDLYMIHIAPSVKSSKDLENFLNFFSSSTYIVWLSPYIHSNPYSP